MKYLTSKKFSFVSDALSPDTFGVVSFRGSEGVSRPYKFEIMLVSDSLEIDFKAVMNSKARLIFHREEGDAFYNGIIANFEQLHEINDHAFYRVFLVPKLWWLSITHHNQVFLDKAVFEFGKNILVDGGFTDTDFDFRLQGTYDPVEYVCQYGESHLNFLSRWIEREGIYYYFEQSDDNEKVIFTDTRVAHTDLPQNSNIIYLPPSALESAHLNEAIRSFHCRKNVLPAKVLLKDYNYRRPSLEITGSADVDKSGRGTVYFYHEHFRTSEEGNKLARIRAENIICKGEEYYGESSVPCMLPGFTFNLTKHYRNDFNQKYLIIEINHEGDQTGLLLPGISPDPGKGKQQMYYRNSFTAIPATTQFRPQIMAAKPKVSGTITGIIDAEGTGQYAELDEMGRYKVTIPFDLSGRTDGKASSWIRMAQPYGGGNHGMHFPLHKGTEVMLTFVNGDPDRPIIVAAIPNPGTPSPVTSANQTSNLITTSGGNKIHMEDKEGNQRIFLHSPVAGSTIRLGSPNTGDDNALPPLDDLITKYKNAIDYYKDQVEQHKHDNDKKGPVDVYWEKMQKFEGGGGKGIELATSNWLDISAQFKNSIILGDENQLVVGGVGDFCFGGREIISMVAYSDITLGLKHDYVWPEWAAFTGTKREVTVKREEANDHRIEITNLKKAISHRLDEINEMRTQVDERFTKVVRETNEANDVIVKAVKDYSVVVNDSLKAINKEVKATKDKMETTATRTAYIEAEVEILTDRVTSTEIDVSNIQTEVANRELQSTNAQVVTTTAELNSQ